MNRRNAIRLGFTAVAIGLAFPRASLAGTSALNSPLAGGLFYTKKAPGRWAGKEGGHAPLIERSGSTIEVTTGHPMNGYEHYIVKHIILDEQYDFVSETMFNPETDSPVSQHDIGGLSRTVYALSVCNLHDTWLSTLTL